MLLEHGGGRTCSKNPRTQGPRVEVPPNTCLLETKGTLKNWQRYGPGRKKLDIYVRHHEELGLGF